MFIALNEYTSDAMHIDTKEMVIESWNCGSGEWKLLKRTKVTPMEMIEYLEKTRKWVDRDPSNPS